MNLRMTKVTLYGDLDYTHALYQDANMVQYFVHISCSSFRNNVLHQHVSLIPDRGYRREGNRRGRLI